MQKEKATEQNNEEYVVSDEALRYRIRKIIDEPKPVSWWKNVSTNPLTAIILGFVLTGIFGALLTNYYGDKQRELERQYNERHKELERQYTERQRELERERSFADELNKIRVGKIGEVWEKVDLYEAAVVSMTEKLLVKSNQEITDQSTDQKTIVVPMSVNDLEAAFNKGELLHTELSTLLDKNRFWLGQQVYEETRKYANTTYEYFIALQQGKVTKEMEEKRLQERASINKIRERLLEGKI